jgi:Family of unknown function (DUF6338)
VRASIGGVISTFQALLVTAIAILPGAVYTIARESRGASWAWRKTDAATLIFRFLTASAFFHLLLAPISYAAYQNVTTNHILSAGHAFPWSWWGWLAAYIAVPYAFGVCMEESRGWKRSPRRVLGWPKNALKWVLASISGADPEPRAWDRLFSKHRTGYITLKLKDNGEWKAGLWYAPSYASAYGEDQDLYIAEQIAVDDAGSVQSDDDGKPIYLGFGLLISWSEVDYVEFADIPDDGSGDDGTER